MKLNQENNRLLILSIIFFLIWFFGAIFPYLLYKSEWNNYKFGDDVYWVNGNSIFYTTYYIFGILGIWKWVLISSMLIFSSALFANLKSLPKICLNVIVAYALTLLIAVNNNCENPIMRVLE